MGGVIRTITREVLRVEVSLVANIGIADFASLNFICFSIDRYLFKTNTRKFVGIDHACCYLNRENDSSAVFAGAIYPFCHS